MSLISSAPTAPARASRSVRAVNPEISTNASVPSTSRYTASGESLSQSMTRSATYGRKISPSRTRYHPPRGHIGGYLWAGGQVDYTIVSTDMPDRRSAGQAAGSSTVTSTTPRRVTPEDTRPDPASNASDARLSASTTV